MENKNPSPDSAQFANAIVELARADAQRAAEKITQPDPKVQKVLRDLYENAFVDGVLYMLKNELDQRIADQMAKMPRRERRKMKRVK